MFGRPTAGGKDGEATGDRDGAAMGDPDGDATADSNGAGRPPPLIAKVGAAGLGSAGGLPATAATTMIAIASDATTTAADDRPGTGKPVKSSPLMDRDLWLGRALDREALQECKQWPRCGRRRFDDGDAQP